MIHINQGILDRKMFGAPHRRNQSEPGHLTFDPKKLPCPLIIHKITVVILPGVSRSLLPNLRVNVGCSGHSTSPKECAAQAGGKREH